MIENSGQTGGLAFGPFRLDAAGRALYRGGAKVVVGGRSLDILCALAAAPDELVTKDALVARVWPGAIVEDNTIQVHMSALRKALDEAGDGRRYIVTVPGQGYRLIAKPTVAMPGEDQPTIPANPSIAVLPFQNMSPDAEQDYFADGVVEEITTALSRIRWLFVIARNSSFAYKGRAVDVRRIGSELGVRYVLEGSVRKSRDHLRIAGQLVDTTSGIQIWADRFDGTLKDVFDLQDQIARKVVSAVTPKLEQAEIERTKRKPATENLDSYDYYLRGLACLHEGTKSSTDRALPLFYKAIELDPNFAAAYGMAASCYSQRKTFGLMDDEAKETSEALRIANRAIELGRDDPTALCWGGYATAYYAHDFDRAIHLIDRALVLNPNFAMAWFCSGWARGRAGQIETALNHLSTALQLSPLDPLSFRFHGTVAFTHFLAQRYEMAISAADLSLKERAGFLFALRVKAASCALGGRLEEARKTMELLRRSDPGFRISKLPAMAPFPSKADAARWADGLRRAGLPK